MAAGWSRRPDSRRQKMTLSIHNLQHAGRLGRRRPRRLAACSFPPRSARFRSSDRPGRSGPTRTLSNPIFGIKTMNSSYALDKSNAKVLGVCAGLARTTGWDPLARPPRRRRRDPAPAGPGRDRPLSRHRPAGRKPLSRWPACILMRLAEVAPMMIALGPVAGVTCLVAACPDRGPSALPSAAMTAAAQTP